MPRGCEKFLIGGNHEDRYPKFLAKWQFFPDRVSKSLRKFSNTWADEYNLTKRKWKWFEYGGHFRIGKITFTHGWGSTSNACQEMTKLFPGQNVMFGHTHRHDVYGCMDSNSLPIEVETIGTLSNFDLAYLRGKPAHNWTRGFSYIYTKDDGTFTKAFIHVINGKFVVNGREFGNASG